MAPRKRFTKADIDERGSWPEIKAALQGPKAYDKNSILVPNQRRKLVQLARVKPEEEKPFIDEVTCNIIQFRLGERTNDQERPAAVAEATRRLIDAYAHVVTVSKNTPVFVRMRVCSTLVL
jgi:hypothetical protein